MTGISSSFIKDEARALGFDPVGIVPAASLTAEGELLRKWLELGRHGEMDYLARHAELRVDPAKLLPGVRSVVCVALNYYQPDPHSDDPEIGKISRYAWGDDYHDVLREKLTRLLARIREQAPEVEGRVCVDTAPIMDKAWAVRAGIGWLGKHTNVITRQYGSWVFLGELLLSIKLEYDNLIEPDHCGKCTACLDACPTGALVAPYQLDATRCISYGTIELRDETLPAPIADNLHNWVFGCDICQDVCPWSRFSKPTGEESFVPRTGITNPPLRELANLSQDEFTFRFRKSAVKRAKVAGLRRNARAARRRSRRATDQS
ncbi:MAG: tRNA epoxyqueuosine(34) reductase QueG [Acidobacteria bacterium]|nr:tRNA epoxyqueuosine(34) reductase QueG [Acidobacteriota bacterium]